MIMNETYLLSDGTSLPKIGFGTYNEAFEDNKASILKAIECGYRFFDTASLYETERPLGAAIRESGIARSDVIIETKLWTDEMGADNARTALTKSLDRLGTDYLDIYMMHWPRQTGADDENWKELDIETYQAMEEMVDKGLVRRLGLSNFLPHHLKNILDNCRIKPVVDQMELHPGYSQEAAVAFCKANDVLPMAWSPLGRGRENATIGNSILVRLAAKYGKSVQQINLRFLLQKGILPIPKASSMEHMKANLEVFDFELTSDDMSMLTCMPQTAWLGEHPDFVIPDRKSNPDNL
jgi:diketogulonate reductase-like aldo/keto reductase